MPPKRDHEALTSSSSSTPFQVQPTQIFVILSRGENADGDADIKVHGACRTLRGAKELAEKHCKAGELKDSSKKGKVVCTANLGRMDLSVEKWKLVVAKDDDTKTVVTPQETKNANESATPATNPHYCYTVVADKTNYCGEYRNVKFVGASLSLPSASKLGSSKLPDKGMLDMTKNLNKLKEGGVIASGMGQKGHKGMRYEAWVQRWSVVDWDEVDEIGGMRKVKKAKKAEVDNE